MFLRELCPVCPVMSSMSSYVQQSLEFSHRCNVCDSLLTNIISFVRCLYVCLFVCLLATALPNVTYLLAIAMKQEAKKFQWPSGVFCTSVVSLQY